MTKEERHGKVLRFIRAYIQSNGEAPTIMEIGKQTGYSSTGGVHKVLTALEQRGSIKRTPNISRGISLVQ